MLTVRAPDCGVPPTVRVPPPTAMSTDGRPEPWPELRLGTASATTAPTDARTAMPFFTATSRELTPHPPRRRRPGQAPRVGGVRAWTLCDGAPDRPPERRGGDAARHGH